MTYPSSPNFTKHSENLAEVSASLVQIERVHKAAIRDGDEAAERALRVVHTVLVGVFAEAQLRKIVSDPTGFTGAERLHVWSSRAQDARWTKAIETAASKHYGITGFDISSLPVDDAQRLTKVRNLITDQLAPVITDRNKLAHGQWLWQLRSLSDEKFRQDQMQLNYNYEQIVGRHQLLNAIAHMVHVLCVSEPTFRRDFDRWTSEVDSAERRMTGSGYLQLRGQLRRSRNRARQIG